MGRGDKGGLSRPRSAVFFDRDGVLNSDIGYAWRPSDLKLMPGVARALSLLRDAGWLSIVVTNQSGIGRGLYTEADMHAFHRALQDEITAEQSTKNAHSAPAVIDAFYFCPFVPNAAVAQYDHPDHADRKPNPGMILRAVRDWNIDTERSFLVGDRDTDVLAAQRAGVTGFLLGEERLDHLIHRELNLRLADKPDDKLQ
jgi:D-glycero-D-manno-heptose 1,7-bisphosphate phosphatase